MKYTTKSVDKFTKTEVVDWNNFPYKGGSIRAKNHANSKLGIIWKKGVAFIEVDEGLGMGMTYMKTNKLEEIRIDYEFHDYNWLFLRQGGLFILLDGEHTITLPAKEIRTKAYSDSNKSKIFEKGYWQISKDDLKKICDSKSIEVAVLGEFKIEFGEAENSEFLFMARSMYNEAIDEAMYLEEIEERETKQNETSKFNTKGCIFFFLIILLVVFAVLLLS